MFFSAQRIPTKDFQSHVFMLVMRRLIKSKVFVIIYKTCFSEGIQSWQAAFYTVFPREHE